MSADVTLSPKEVRTKLGISRPQLRNWERLGILCPLKVSHHSRVWREYTPGEAEKIRRIIWLLKNGMTLRGAVQKLPQVEALEQAGRQFEPVLPAA